MEVSYYFVINLWNNLFSGSRELQEFERETIWKSRSDTDRAARSYYRLPIWSVKYANSPV